MQLGFAHFPALLPSEKFLICAAKTWTVGGGVMEKIIAALWRRIRQLPTYVVPGLPRSAVGANSSAKQNATRRKKGKLSFEEWQILNPGGTFKDYTAKLPFKK